MFDFSFLIMFILCTLCKTTIQLYYPMNLCKCLFECDMYLLQLSGTAIWHVVEPPPTEKSGNPCIPSPCGPNSKCLDVRGSPACSCLPDYLGRPPNCRPECLSSADCPANLACVNQRCSNPCIGACGLHSVCTVIKHRPACECVPGYTGDPFSGCAIVQQSNIFLPANEFAIPY